MSQSASKSNQAELTEESTLPEEGTLQTDAPKTYPCPRCATHTAWQDNPNKPFCSARCKLIDLGAWANEDYKVAAEISPFSSDISQDFPDR